MFHNRPKPKTPELDTTTYHFYLDEEGKSFSDITAYVIKQKGDPNSICITGAEDDWEEGRRISSITISFKESQDSSTYQYRLAKYEEDLAMWEFWYSRNKDAADAATAAEKEALKLKATRELESKIRGQEWVVKKAQLDLKALQDKLNEQTIGVK